jgi:hypothetical protein
MEEPFMTTTVRLPHRIEQALATYCVEQKLTKSEVIIELLEHSLLGDHQETAPYELAQAAGFIGCVNGAGTKSGDSDATVASNTAANAKKLVRQKIRAKHSR